MASRIIQTPDPGPDLGQSLDSGQDFGPYLPNVTAARGANSIEEISTPDLNQLTQIQVVIDGSLQFWQLQTGAAGSDTENQVAPLDDPTIHWQRVGGFGIAMMAAARVYNSASVSIPNNVPTTIPFDTARFNSGEWDATTNPSRITAIVDGVYSISGMASFAANATGQRKLDIRLNGSNSIASDQLNNASSSVATNLSVSTVTALLAGDYVEMVATQTSGGNLSVLQSSQYSPEFAAVRLSAFDSVNNFNVTPPTPNSVPPGVTVTSKDFSVSDIGWYRIWSGGYPASGSFNIIRSDNGDGQTSDTLVDFTIIAASPEGIINITRNAIPSPSSPSIDGVRVYHDPSVSLAYVDIHLLRGGTWTLQYSSADDSFVDAPFLYGDITGLTTLTYGLKPNITGGTGNIDVPQINSSGNKLLAPNTGVTWAAATGTPSRSTFDTSTATLTQLAQRFKALEDDLITQGIFQVGIPASMTYVNMLELSASLIGEGQVANVTDIFQVTAAPDTTVKGIYVPVGTFNSHTNYRLQGYEWDTASARCCRWSTEHSTWTILNASGNLYHSAATESTPWGVVQWKDESNVNQTVTTVAPNTALTYNALTDTHTAMVFTDLTGTSGYAGMYLRGSDLNTKRRYYLVGTSSNNKRMEWDGVSTWSIKDDSTTFATAVDSSTYPDQVATWIISSGGGGSISVTGVNAVDLMSGVTVGDITSTYNGTYVPVQAIYNVLAGRNLVYRRDDGVYYLSNDGTAWELSATAGGTIIIGSDTNGVFPWQASWTIANITVQQNKIASAGWNNLATQPNTNITNNVIGDWHL